MLHKKLTKKEKEELKGLAELLKKYNAQPCTTEDLPDDLVCIAGSMPTQPIKDKNGREIKITDGRELKNVPKREIN